MSHIDRTCEARARRQRGVLARWQAVQDGMPGSTFDDRVARGEYRLLRPGVAALPGVPDSRGLRYFAALLYVGGEAVLSHATAASIWGLDGCGPDFGIHVLVGVRTFPELDLTVHRTRYLEGHHVTERDGLAVTTPERTLCDLAGNVSFTALRKAVNDALRRGLIRPATLSACAAELGRFRGKRHIRMIMDELSPLERWTANEMESLFLRLTTRAGIPPDAMNHVVRLRSGRRRVLDAVWLNGRVVWVELDSEWHDGPIAERDDAERTEELVAEGWPPPLRYRWHDLTRRPDRVITELREELDLA